jgi:hypothetical protein
MKCPWRLPALALAAILAEPAGWAVEESTVSEAQVEGASGFQNEVFGFRPQVGLTTRNNFGDTSAKALGGLLMDVNFFRLPPSDQGRPYVGLVFGALYSHLGNPGSDFIGLGGAGGDSGTNFLQLPVNIKAGYTFSDVFRLTVHGGLNVLYSHTNLSAVFPAVAGSSTTWNGFGNIGMDFEFGVARSLAVLLRPDWTFASGDTFLTVTFGLNFPIS